MQSDIPFSITVPFAHTLLMLSAFLATTLALNVAPRTPHAKLVFVRHGQVCCG